MPMRSNLAAQSAFPICSVCNEPIELRTTKLNETGEPIHEECYVLDHRLERDAIVLASSEEDVSAVETIFPQAIIEFLNNASTHPVTNRCPDCGSDLEYRECTFFYEGQTWEVPLPICIICCHPPQQPPTDDA
jgi:uncharacterized protein with PIN domain